VYIIHGDKDAIVPFYHGQTLFQNLPDPTKTVPFWAQGAGHNNIERDMSTAFVKRLLQFIRQCDRINEPRRTSRRRAQLQQQAQQQQPYQQAHQQARQHAHGASLLSPRRNDGVTIHGPAAIDRPGYVGYASKVHGHHAIASHPSTTIRTADEMMSSKPSKQRKRKGTLVMRSTSLPTPNPPYTTRYQHLASQISGGAIAHSAGHSNGGVPMSATQIACAPSALSTAIHQQQHHPVSSSDKAAHHQQLYAPHNVGVQHDCSTGPSMPSGPLSPPHHTLHDRSQNLLRQNERVQMQVQLQLQRYQQQQYMLRQHQRGYGQ
jgi:hypothetical protein